MIKIYEIMQTHDPFIFAFWFIIVLLIWASICSLFGIFTCKEPLKRKVIIKVEKEILGYIVTFTYERGCRCSNYSSLGVPMEPDEHGIEIEITSVFNPISNKELLPVLSENMLEKIENEIYKSIKRGIL